MTRFAVGIPTISSLGTLRPTVEGVLAQEDVDVDILLVMNGSVMESECDSLVETYPDRVSVYKPYFNMGCSRSWNYAAKCAWEKGQDKIFLINDDLVLHDTNVLARIAQGFLDQPKAHYHVAGYSAVAISKENWDWFDEGFYPAYFEDNDHYQRTVVKHGLDWTMLTGVNYNHETSSSLRTSTYFARVNMRTFVMNRQRYIEKWGGVPHAENFTEAWNGGQPTVKGTKELLEEQGWTEWYE